MKYIYDKKDSSPMRVAVFFSGGASSMRAMLNDPNYPTLYEIVVAFTNKDECSGIAVGEEADIPVVRRSFKKFCQEKGIDPKDFSQRAVYYEAVIKDLESHAPDIVCLSGFTGPGSIIVEPFLTEYADRILNVHPADLAILASKEGADFSVSRIYAGNLSVPQAAVLVSENDLERRYKGEDAVYDAVISGEDYTRSSVHIARKVFDEGPLLVQSQKFAVKRQWVRAKLSQRNFRAVRTYADDLQETMKWEGDGPAYLKALELISQGNLALDRDTVWADGQELPYMGFGLG